MQTEQISRHSSTTSASDADFVQSTPKEELSLDQAVTQRNSKSREFHVIRFGSSITTQIPHNLHQFPCLLLGKECIEQGRESREFHVIHFRSSSIMRILRSSHQIVCFLCTQLRTEIGEVNSPDSRIHIYLKVCIVETGNKVIRPESVSVAINRKWY